ncbi:MAG: hydroxymethylbilane synthase [Ignavibacteria bacterium]|nr:hydroxymethylbilane synthase [Ignavibacteria bacterium]
MNKNVLIIGTRGSDLALWQATVVKKELERKSKNLNVEIKIISTKGDKILDTSLSKIGDKGLFTKELENELLNGSIDIAVHSLKDLPTKLPDGLMLGAVTKRYAAQDVLIGRKKKIKIMDLPENAVVATGSLRRSSQLLHVRPDITTEELRGNVPTRINKFLQSGWDAIILARAGVERLKLNKYVSSVIPISQMLPAVGQGALGIEIKRGNKTVLTAIKKIHHEPTSIAVRAERALLKKLEGGCQVPIGAYASITKSGLSLDAVVGSIDGSITFRKKLLGSIKEPEKLGEKLARQLLEAGASQILSDIFKQSRS